MTEETREIRRILLGYIAFEDQNMVAAQKGRLFRALGVFNGSGAARVLGILHRKRRYTLDGQTLDSHCDAAFAGMGRRIRLDTAPEKQAVFFCPPLRNPCVLTSEMKEDALEVSVYTARGLSGLLYSELAFRRWKKAMPEALIEQKLAREKPVQTPSAPKPDRAQRQAAKKEKRAKTKQQSDDRKKRRLEQKMARQQKKLDQLNGVSSQQKK